jgi:hypothetical protein
VYDIAGLCLAGVPGLNIVASLENEGGRGGGGGRQVRHQIFLSTVCWDAGLLRLLLSRSTFLMAAMQAGRFWCRNFGPVL